MTHPTCATCRWWSPSQAKDEGICVELGLYAYKPPVEKDNRMFCVAATDHTDSIRTGPDFYCPHHQPHPDVSPAEAE